MGRREARAVGLKLPVGRGRRLTLGPLGFTGCNKMLAIVTSQNQTPGFTP